MNDEVYPYYGSGSIPYVDRAAYLAAESTRELLAASTAKIIIHQDVPATIDPATGAILDAGVQSVLKDSAGIIDLDDAIAKAEEYSLDSFVTEYGEEAAPEMLDRYITEEYGSGAELNGDMSEDEWMMEAYPTISQVGGTDDISSLLESMREKVGEARTAVGLVGLPYASSDEEENKALEIETKVRAALDPGTKVLGAVSKAGDKVVGEGNGKWLVSAAALVAAGWALLRGSNKKNTNRL